MNRPSNSSNKVFVVVAAVLAIVNLVDYVFYGQQLRNLAGAAGFGLMAFGAHKHRNWASIAGAVIAIGALVLKYFF